MAAASRFTRRQIAPSLAISNSIAVNGCCLTVVALDKERFSADLSGETIRRTSFGARSNGHKVGTRVNLEQPLTAGKEFGGHFVLGHVDGVGRVTSLQAEGENWWYGVQVPEEFARYIVPKGSITIDGISLTVARWYAFSSNSPSRSPSFPTPTSTPTSATASPATPSISKATSWGNTSSATYRLGHPAQIYPFPN